MPTLQDKRVQAWPVCLLVFFWQMCWSVTAQIEGLAGQVALKTSLQDFTTTADTLVVYVYSNTNPEYQRNFHFFLQHGIQSRDNHHYIIIIQDVLADEPLPELPEQAQYLSHKNECFDWGTYGWVLGMLTPQKLSTYKHFVFLNSSIRGPFVPQYWPKSLHWTRIFTSKLTASVKLVGATISCGSVHKDGDINKGTRSNPHVQSYVAVTDQTGLGILQQEGNVFKCFHSVLDAVWHAELGSSAAIFDAGYTIDSLMLRYAGVDWTNRTNHECNAMFNPYAQNTYDGQNLNPLEVVFVKMKDFMLDANWPAQRAAEAYDSWMTDQGRHINTNKYATHHQKFLEYMQATLNTWGPDCFDFDYYETKNSLEDGLTAEQLWHHFVHKGQFLDLPFRFTCERRISTWAVDQTPHFDNASRDKRAQSHHRAPDAGIVTQ